MSKRLKPNKTSIMERRDYIINIGKPYILLTYSTQISINLFNQPNFFLHFLKLVPEPNKISIMGRMEYIINIGKPYIQS